MGKEWGGKGYLESSSSLPKQIVLIRYIKGGNKLEVWYPDTRGWEAKKCTFFVANV